MTTNKESHLARGITKEGKEVVGYYHNYEGTTSIDGKRTTYEQHFILSEDFHPEADYQDNWCCFDEITSPPQKCLGIRDCEGELIFDNDYLLDDRPFEPKQVYIANAGCMPLIISPIPKSLEDELPCDIEHMSNQILKHLTYKDYEGMKIIHPTNKEGTNA